MYDSRRYFVMTGWHVRGTPTTIEPRQHQLGEVLAFVFGDVAPRSDTSRDVRRSDMRRGELLAHGAPAHVFANTELIRSARLTPPIVLETFTQLQASWLAAQRREQDVERLFEPVPAAAAPELPGR